MLLYDFANLSLFISFLYGSEELGIALAVSTELSSIAMKVDFPVIGFASRSRYRIGCPFFEFEDMIYCSGEEHFLRSISYPLLGLIIKSAS